MIARRKKALAGGDRRGRPETAARSGIAMPRVLFPGESGNGTLRSGGSLGFRRVVVSAAQMKPSFGIFLAHKETSDVWNRRIQLA